MEIDDLERRQRIEMDCWRNSPTERPESNSVENIVNELGDAEVFLDLVKRFQTGCELDFYPSTQRRAPVETIYYTVLRAIPPLRRILPCAVNYHFIKPAGQSRSSARR